MGSLSLAGALQAYREQAGLSKRALSQKAHLSPSYVGKLEAGEIEPSVKAFLCIARALNLTQIDVVFCIRLALAEIFSGEECQKTNRETASG